MKKLMGLAAIALLFSLTINAQQKGETANKRSSMTSEQKATLQSKKLALQLDLDKQQQAAVYEIMKKNADERQLKSTELREKRKQGVELSNEERFQIQNERLEHQLEQKAAMKSILSQEQYEKWEKSGMAKKRNARSKKWKASKFKQRRMH